MQLPKRRSQILAQKQQSAVIHLTEEGEKGLKDELKRLDTVERPQAIKDLTIAREKGDLSENAEYHDARARLTRLEYRILTIKEQLKRVSIIKKPMGGKIGLGSTVTIQSGSESKTYRIVGPHESNVSEGRISHISPLGSALMGSKNNDVVTMKTASGEKQWTILGIK